MIETETEKLQRYSAADIAQIIKDEGGFAPVTVSKNDDGSLEVEAATSTGLLSFTADSELSAYLLPLDDEEIGELIVREARDL